MPASGNQEKNHIESLLAVLHDPLAVALRARWNAFNPFRVLKAEKRELRHTTTLAWLLNPRESHGLGDQFLRGFLKSVCSAAGDHSVLLRYETDGDASVRVHPELRMEKLRILGFPEFNNEGDDDEADIDDRRASGKRRLDVLVEGDRWAVAIEAKIGAGENDGQLGAYRTGLEKWAGEKRSLLLVYLTIDEQDEQREGWSNAIWSTSVAQPLRAVLEASGQTAQLGDHQHAFLASYLEVLSDVADDANGPVNRHLSELASAHTPALRYLKDLKSSRRRDNGDSVSELAVLYRRNQRLLDRLLDYVDSNLEARANIITATMRDLEFMQVKSENSYLRFIPRGWDTDFPWIYEPTDAVPRVLFEIRNQAKDNRISINLQVWHLDGDRYVHELHREQRAEMMRKIQADETNSTAFNRKGRPDQKLSAMVQSIATAAIRWNTDDAVASKRELENTFKKFVSCTQPVIEKYLQAMDSRSY